MKYSKIKWTLSDNNHDINIKIIIKIVKTKKKKKKKKKIEKKCNEYVALFVLYLILDGINNFF